MSGLVAAKLSKIFRTNHGLADDVAIFDKAVPAIPKLKGELAPYWVHVTDQTDSTTAEIKTTYGVNFPTGINNRANLRSPGTVVDIKYPTGVPAIDGQ